VTPPALASPSNPRLISPPYAKHFLVSFNRTIFREQET
jgi:hypothetical protein